MEDEWQKFTEVFGLNHGNGERSIKHTYNDISIIFRHTCPIQLINQTIGIF